MINRKGKLQQVEKATEIDGFFIDNSSYFCKCVGSYYRKKDKT